MDYVKQQLREFLVPPERICFEITQTTAIRNLTQATRFMTAIRAYGCGFALDGFGSGLSSFTCLKHLPVDYLKIDGSIVRDMDTSPIDRAMVAAINQFGHLMFVLTIAEYTESETIAEQLKALGVDYAQGHWLGSPRPLLEGESPTSTIPYH